MINSNVDEIDTKQNETKKEQNDTSGQKSSLIVLKEESFEEESLNKVVITEITDEVAYKNNVNASVNTEDTVIYIGVNETRQAPQTNASGKTRLWPFIHRHTLLTRYLWQQGVQRQKRHQWQGKQGHRQQWHILQGYPQKKQQVMLQHDFYIPPERHYFGAGYDDGPGPLDYDPSTRNSFVLIVMMMVLIMLLITTAFIATVLTTPYLQDFFIKTGTVILVLSMIGILIANYVMMFSVCARRPPCSYIMLIISTVCMSSMAAQVSSHYRTYIIFFAAVVTTAIVIVCLLLACTTFDFTQWALYVVVIGTAISVSAIVVFLALSYAKIYIKPIHLGVLIVSILIQSVVLVIELQMVLGGKTIEIAEDDYALAAFMLYTSIVDVFVKIVQILGLMEDV